MNKKIFLLMFGMILLFGIIGAVSAQTLYENPHNLSMISPGTSTFWRGAVINITNPGGVYIKYLTIASGVTTTEARIIYSINSSVIATTSTLIGQNFSFSTPIYLSPNINYTIQTDAGGANYNLYWSTSTSAYPFKGKDISWINGIVPGAPDRIGNFINIWEYPSTGLDINLQSPLNNTGVNTTNITFKANVNSLNQPLTNVSLYLDGLLNQTNSSGINKNYSFPVSGLTNGKTYNWTVGACNSAGCSNSSTYYFTVDTQSPNLNVSSPTGTFNYLYTGYNMTLNFTASDNLNLDTVWYSYNGTNTTLSVTNGTLKTVYFPYQGGQNSLTVYANDSAGNVASQTTSWIPLFTEVSQSYSNNTFETSNENFTLNFQKDSSVTSFSGTFNYNGVSYQGVVSCGGTCLTKQIQIPSGISTGTFNWTINFQTATQNYTATSKTYTQTVSNLSLYECSVPSGMALNFTTYDIDTLTRLNASFQSTFQFQLNSGSIYKTYNYESLNENKSNWMFCLNSGGQNVTLTSFTSYYTTGYDRRNYLINNGTIGNFTQNIPLYLASTASTDIVNFYIYDENLNPLSGAEVIAQRWDVGRNEFLTAGMFTVNNDGQGSMNLRLYDTFYRFIVIYKGQVVTTTNSEVLPSNTKRIQVTLGVPNSYQYFDNIAHSLTFDNSTNYTQFSWTDTSGYVQTGCLNVSRVDPLGNTLISSSCLNSVSGILNYQLPSNATYLIQGYIRLTSSYNSVSNVVDSLYVTLGTPTRTAALGGTTKMLSFLAIGTALVIGASTGSIVFGSLLLGATSAGLMMVGFWNISTGLLWTLISLLILILFRGGNKY